MTLHTIETGGAKLAVHDTGAGDVALIFLHYWGGSVATDGRHDLDALGDDVLAVTEALAVRRFILVGHSMGGKIA